MNKVAFKNRATKLLVLALLVNFACMTNTSTAQAQGRVIGSLNPLLGSSLPSYRYDDYDLEKYENLEYESARRLEQARRVLSDASEAFDDAKNDERNVARELEVQSRNLESNRRQEGELNAKIRQQKDSIEDGQRRLPQLAEQISSLENQVNSTSSVIAELGRKKDAAATEAEKQEIQGQIDTQNQVLAGLQQSLSAKKSEKENLASEINNTARAMERASAELNQVRNEASNIQRNIENAKRNLEIANRKTRELDRAHEMAQRQYNDVKRDLDTVRNDLDEVRSNIARASRILAADGEKQGSDDGFREGKEIGEVEGKAKGKTTGERDGREKGTAEGKDRDYNAGHAAGVEQAKKDAFKQAETDAKNNGKRDGEANGVADGLKFAYDTGMREGLDNGAKTGDDKEAYAQGRREGEAAGMAKAIEDAKPQEPLGYRERENQFLNAPLKSVVVGDANLAAKFKGLQGRYSEDGDDRYYRPQPGLLPHPRLEKYFVDAYDLAYRDEVKSSYAEYYEKERKIAYDSNYAIAREAAFKKDYPESREDGRKKGYTSTYQDSYDANYKEMYPIIYKSFYDPAFNRNKGDVNERSRGYKDGNRIASRQKGYNEGHKAVYDANIDLEKKKAFAAGVARANNLYSNNPVIKVTSLELKEVDADGIYRPGESLAVVIKLKNFGLKPKVDLQSEITNVRGDITVTAAKQTTGSVPEQSDATVIVPVQSTVARSAVDGSSFSITVNALTGSSVHLTQNFNIGVQYPAKVQVSGFDGILIPGVETPVKVVVQNRSRAKQNLVLNLALDAAKVVSDVQSIAVSDLAAGQSREVIVKLTGKIEARFEESGLEIQTAQSNLQFAMAEKKTLTIIRKHAPTADSKGLILSANLAAGAGKKLFSMDKLDTWDLRVDGAVRELAKIESYKTKVIHILADEGAQMDAATLATIKSFIDANGSIIVWGSKLDKSPMAQSLIRLLGVKIQAADTINSVVKGKDKLWGADINVRGQVLLLAPENVKGAQVLMADRGAVGVIVFASGIAEVTGQSLVLGLDVNDLEASDVQKLTGVFGNVRTSFTAKLEQAMKNPQSVSHLIAQDIANEMISAELLGTGDFYKKNDSNNKIARAAKKFIGEAGRKSAQAKEMARYYPYFISVIKNNLSKEAWRAELVLEKRYGSFFSERNFKDIFCESNSGHDLCKSDPNL